MNDVILWEVENKIGKLILNCPPSNSMNSTFFKRLKFIADNLILSSDIKALIIYGTGRHYSSGADLNNLFDIIKDETSVDDKGKIVKYPEMIMENIKIFNMIYNLGIPVVSAIKGVCIGSGLELALFSHIRICSEGSIFGFPEITYNLMPGCGGIMRLQELSGTARTLDLVLHGNLFPCEDALNYRVIDRILPKKQFFDKIMEFLNKISEGYKKEKIRDYLKLLS
jgi:enoyl-CoA hydratase/carnithine racemase